MAPRAAQIAALEKKRRADARSVMNGKMLDIEKNVVRVTVSMFGRETAVELDALQVKKIDD